MRAAARPASPRASRSARGSARSSPRSSASWRSMIEQIRAAFLPRFRVLARARVARARDLAAGGAGEALANELHALAGEAAVLELTAFADLVRGLEPRAREKNMEGWPALFDRIA